MELNPAIDTFHLVSATMLWAPDLLRDIGELPGARTVLLNSVTHSEASSRFQGLLVVEHKRLRQADHKEKVQKVRAQVPAHSAGGKQHGEAAWVGWLAQSSASHLKNRLTSALTSSGKTKPRYAKHSGVSLLQMHWIKKSII
ncbi:hypothetical protein [Comamonas aquatica]|uniref:hypothetical protein n=1 Tax=Comamonas aquatica TaxID=225991 RepID=UPI001F17DDDA|nr:hypothetical protein [Comamonas aquatica]